MPRPTLIIVSGAPGSGKTSLAHAIARSIGCPVISRDEIKEGIVHAEGGEFPEWGGPVSVRTHKAFFDAVRLLIGAGVSLVAEAAFQDELWRPDLEPLLGQADVCIVHCTVDATVARDRIASRARNASRAAHPHAQPLEALDTGKLSLERFDPISLFARATRVDTTDGYHPDFDEIVAFVGGSASSVR